MLYRVSCLKDPTVVYTKSIVAVRELQDLAANNGYKVVVQRMSKKDVPLGEIDLIVHLDETDSDGHKRYASGRVLSRDDFDL